MIIPLARMTESKVQNKDTDPSFLKIDKSDSTPFRILTLDGGGAKGFYTLGVLKEIEGLLKSPLYTKFDLIFGTSTGSIIAALIALGYGIDEIHDLYRKYVPEVMKCRSASNKSSALEQLAHQVFGYKTFADVKTGIGIVATKWLIEKPMIFKGNISQAHGRKGTFDPGFGVNIADAVQASCSAYPFFKRKIVRTSSGDDIELFDGGFCANNPSLYALADALGPMNRKPEEIRLVSVGVGVYPQPKIAWWNWKRYASKIWPVKLLQKTLEVNTHSMEQLRSILFPHVKTVRFNDAFERPEMATDLMEHDLKKLNILHQRGKESFTKHEDTLRAFLNG